MAHIAAGRLDRRIAIQSATEVADAAGEPIQTWATTVTLWASYEEARGEEHPGADQRVAKRRVQFGIRYRTDVAITPRRDRRIVFDSRNYDILAVHEDARFPRRSRLTIEAEARAE